jgi:diaminohydroxyphosphoribosylaminopyrimidine deaminase / 5-amino-6-(5-phosphoribosylamino)uracil reductase
MKTDHTYYMKLAMKLALKSRGQTFPNPMVGAVVVKSGRIVGTGYHRKAGEAHAEAVALDMAGKKAAGAVLYVTLEPCAHYGRTPPCVEKIISSGIRQVIVGMVDPNPLVNGRGIAILQRHGIKVDIGILKDDLAKINRPFIKYITRRIPFVTVKVGQSLDGKIATRTGHSKWITSDAARAYAHRIRKEFDAIMIGSNTLLRDDPTLDPWFSPKKLTKIIVDSQLSTPPDANIFANGSKVIIATLATAPGQETDNRRVLSQKAKILEIKEVSGQIHLRDLLKKLARLEISNIIVEGGGNLIGSLFDEGLVDRCLFFISPKIIGGRDATSSVMGKGVADVGHSFVLKEKRIRPFGPDLLIEGYI